MDKLSDLTGYILCDAVKMLEDEGRSYQVKKTQDPKSEVRNGERRVVRHIWDGSKAILTVCDYS